MKPFTDCQKEEAAAAINLSALISEIMSSSDNSSRIAHVSSPQPSFRWPNLEGTNVGASMIVRRGSACSGGEMNDSCGINIYINNNVQGVNNSIMIGSRLYMGDPGVWLTLKDSKLERWFSKKISSIPPLGFYVLLILVIIIACFLVFFI